MRFVFLNRRSDDGLEKLREKKKKCDLELAWFVYSNFSRGAPAIRKIRTSELIITGAVVVGRRKTHLFYVLR